MEESLIEASTESQREWQSTQRRIGSAPVYQKTRRESSNTQDFYVSVHNPSPERLYKVVYNATTGQAMNTLQQLQLPATAPYLHTLY